MTLEEQFNAAVDITPSYGYMTTVRDGKTVHTPLLPGSVGCLVIGDAQGVYIDSDVSEWLIGTQNGKLVKQRFA